ncbi:MAG TPA: thiamine diphosphokinase [Candidatus Fusicatenibacter intestinigallinarum]|uniref:Thiamine diphosphokinase n=1 Tax=Candidatus Fusicatenibacter intestinigallinarum TaxID=2838598 RepID=A0A9D2N9T9_9FIRM|nr:thiamine diphosphokinase [Candidatus Fusicatenibacter intestinigallinarum]
MKTCIIAGGMLEREFALRFIQEQNFDIILAADRGLEFCSQENIRPTYILGDFDSLKEGVLDKYKEERDIPIREFNPVKDNTDMDLALQQAIILGSREIHILGGTGGRLDHFFSTVQNLKKAWLKHIPAYLVDSRNLITLPCEKEFVIDRETQHGTYVSFMPLEEQVTGLTLEGFKYPLDHFTLTNMSGGLGVSNEILAEQGRVSYKDGILLMIQSKD